MIIAARQSEIWNKDGKSPTLTRMEINRATDWPFALQSIKRNLLQQTFFFFSFLDVTRVSASSFSARTTTDRHPSLYTSTAGTINVENLGELNLRHREWKSRPLVNFDTSNEPARPSNLRKKVDSSGKLSVIKIPRGL